jgi:hypothetical protein
MATPEHWADVEQWGGTLTACLIELRARIEALEGKYETMRLATLDWGEDIDNHSRWIDDQLKRIEALEAAANDRQQDEDNERAMPDAPPADGLVQRVADVFLHKPFTPDDPVGARAAIREVAAWMRQNEIGYAAAAWLEREAKL